MSGLFNEEPTVVMRRSNFNLEQNEAVHESFKIDLTGAERLIEGLNIYGSPLLNAVTELIGILVTIPRQGSPLDIDRFRQSLINAIASFRQKGVHLDYHPSIIEKSCFVLCAAFDEAILYTTWGEKARWENHSLLSKTFSERNGGEVFFQLLDKACEQPAKLVDFIELQYVLLMLGFKGRYRHKDETDLHEIKSGVYEVLRHYRTESVLPIPRTPTLPTEKEPWRMWSMRKLAALAGLLIVSGYVFSEYWYYNRSQTIIAQSQLIDKTSASINEYTLEQKIDAENENAGNSIKESMMHSHMNEVDWEILLAVFSTSADANQLAAILNKSGYSTALKQNEHGIELVIKASNDLLAIRKLNNELKVKFGLNATIRKAQK
ncbi:DotU family type IV/VI secretion system protein [Parashewanella spongiae]|uniref:DotU family type IV/VI secretion system protein n=1 Tax=Parashewanella spongiae TaxID=342950 RepID=A0A3A6UCC2_9GAMM|nr:type IVB secretion system protein IcmH/DotU [Parashewanella spongiae]MCL1078168.1 type IVB secretion system protein IcmH/DotU [Parashewanella spongiae]RJY14895.1 DotU family type IV/VI secretion system protein [Parashewanella spongiae]